MLIVAEPALALLANVILPLFVSTASADPAVEESLNAALELLSTLSCASAFVEVPLNVMEPPFCAINVALAAEVDGEPAAELPKTMLAVFATSSGELDEVS